MRRAATIVFAGLVATGALAACGGGGVTGDAVKKVVENATGCKVNGQDKSTSVQCKGKNGNDSFSVGSDAKLPNGFPKGAVPIPDGKILTSLSVTNGGKDSYNVTVKVDGSVSDAASRYRSKLEGQGYRIDQNSQLNIGGDTGGFSTFTAVGTDWDVTVIGGGGGGTSGKDSGLSIQVSPHDPSRDSSSGTTDTSTSTG